MLSPIDFLAFYGIVGGPLRLDPHHSFRCRVRFLALFVAGLLLTAQVEAQQKHKPDLRLTASMDTNGPERQPMLVVHIVNKSGHSLRIPDPPLLCKPAPGALSLQVKFIPESSKEKEGESECGLEVAGGGLPDIRERAKNWLVLKQGQDYEARRPLGMALNTVARGIYEMRVIYDGPAANPEDLQKLKEVGIAVPNGRFQSNKLTYKVTSPKR